MTDRPAATWPARLPTRVAGWGLALAAAVGLAIAVQVHFGINPDTAWALEMAERTLGGAVPYRDFTETNPPAAFLIEVPAVLTGRALDISRETAAGALTLLGAACSLALSSRILARARLTGPAPETGLLLAAVVALVLMPMGSFAQREHVAALAILPGLAALGVRARGHNPGLALAVLAGLGAGVAVSIKPFFLLALLGPLAWALSGPSRRRVAASPELWIAGLVAVVYAGGTAAAFPDYATRMLPVVLTVYLPARLDLLSLLLLPISLVWILTALVFLRAGGWSDPIGRVLMLASAGFMLAMVVQGKGFTYHGYPALALGSLAAVAAALRGPVSALNRVAAVVAMLAGIAVLSDQRTAEAETPGLAAAIAALAPHPRLLTIGNDILYGPAFARAVGGLWVGSTPTTWVTNAAAVIVPDPEHAPRFADAIATERTLFASDIVNGRPDAVLIEGEAWRDWALRGLTLAQALTHYPQARRFGRFILLTPATVTPAGATRP